MHRISGLESALRLPLLTVLGALLALGALPLQAHASGGYLGVYMQEIDEALAAALDLPKDQTGVLLSDIVKDSPAEDAGLQRGDVILAVDGKSIEDPAELRRLVDEHDAGEVLRLTLLRKGERLDLEAALGPRPEPEERETGGFGWRWMDDGDHALRLGDDDGRMIFLRGEVGPRLGLRLEELEPELGHYFGADEGLLTLEVFDDTDAARAGVKPGDVLVELDGKPLTELRDLRRRLADHEKGDEVALVVLRDRERKTLRVELSEDDMPMLGQFHGLRGLRMEMPPRAPRIERLRRDRDNEIDELREELRQLRKEIDRLHEKG